MNIQMISKTGRINERFSWVNPPPPHEVKKGRLHVSTAPNTDFWQGTHYGFRRDNGHCLLTGVTHDFSLRVRTEFSPQEQYDQCGLFVMGNSTNWIKVSTEYENKSPSRLGSVVTNYGWSDWATTDVDPSVNLRWYRIQKRGKDFLIEYSDTGKRYSWHQLRILHLHRDFARLGVGIYACSPMENIGFEAIFDHFALGDSQWKKPA